MDKGQLGSSLCCALTANHAISKPFALILYADTVLGELIRVKASPPTKLHARSPKTICGEKKRDSLGGKTSARVMMLMTVLTARIHGAVSRKGYPIRHPKQIG